jgi:16S rRNA (cytosine967-C5)-methyltransferase
MSRLSQYISSAQKILASYDGQIPFAEYIRNYFSREKKYGSKDRKHIASLCYQFFRIGRTISPDDHYARIIAGIFLCNSTAPEGFEAVYNNAAQISQPVEKKIELMGLDTGRIFPAEWLISPLIDSSEFILSHLQQPFLFARIRPGHETDVIKKLNQSGIYFELEGDCLILNIGEKISELLVLNRDVVIQDRNSQRVLSELERIDLPDEPCVWDCCAASGGKSILCYDLLKHNLKLTASDNRKSILLNYRKRLEDAGIKHHKDILLDLTIPAREPGLFDIIINDVPCTGSGTWSRTPERLLYFDPESISQYVSRQQKIIDNTVTHLTIGGYYFYITCSVYQNENEDMVNYIRQKFSLSLQSMEYLKGAGVHADTLFVACFRKIT